LQSLQLHLTDIVVLRLFWYELWDRASSWFGNKSRASTERTARCRCKFRYVSNFTMASRGFSATAGLSCWSVCR